MRKSTGIVRRIDSLGRVVVPMELRRLFGIDENDPVEIFTEADRIILKPYRIRCGGCGSEEVSDLKQIGNVTLCASCAEKIASGK